MDVDAMRRRVSWTVGVFDAPGVLGLFVALLVSGCAQVGSPTGGAKDETPPSLVAAVPEVGATEVMPDRLVLAFDEYVKAGQWRPQLLVSPPLDGPMDLIVRGREVELSWEGGLKENTTYVFQFGEGIVDVNEGNPAEQLVHAFSTGGTLDTLAIRGVVRDAIKGTPSKDLRVMLYPESLPLDSILAGVAPQFVGTTNGEGAFEVGYLPEGRFRLMAIEDANRNYAWDAGERAAVGPTAAMAGDTTLWELRSGNTEGPRAPYLSEARWDSTGHASWMLSEPIEPSDSLSWADSSDVTLLEFDKNRIHAWGWTADTTALRLVWHHAPVWAAGEWTTDTMDVPTPRWTPSESLELVAKPLGKRLPGERPTVTWSAPISGVDTSQMALLVDSVPVPVLVESRWPSMQMEIVNEACVKAGAQVSLKLFPGALIRAGVEVGAGAGAEAELFPKDTLDLAWSVKPQDALSEWILHLEGVGCPGMVELTDNQSKRLDAVSVQGDTTLRWTSLAPGKVSATWWGDLDGDEVWRSVDVPTWRAPEPVLKLSAEELRPNWVLETTWTLDASACGTVAAPVDEAP